MRRNKGNRLEIREVNYSYENASGRVEVLKDINAEFHEGKCMPLWGRVVRVKQLCCL